MSACLDCGGAECICSVTRLLREREKYHKALLATHADLVEAVRAGNWNTVADAVETIRICLGQ